MPLRFPTLVVLLTLLLAASCDSVEERAEAHYERGLALISEGDFDRAIVELRNVFQLDGSHRGARHALGSILLNEKKNVAAAYGQYLRLAEQYSDDLDARIVLGEIAFGIGNWEEFERHSLKAIELNPELPRVRALSAAVDYRTAALEDDAPALRERIRDVNALLQTSPDNPVLRRLLVDSQIREGQFQQAIASLDWLLERTPDDESFWRQRANLLVQLQDFDALEAQLKDMVVRFPNDTNHKSTLIRFYMSRQQSDDAEAFLRDLVAAAPEGDIGPRVDLIRFLTEVRGSEAGREEVKAAIADTPDERRFHVLAASMDYEAGLRGAAIKTLETTLDSADPEDALTFEIRVTLARMLLGTDNEVGARAQVESVLEKDPEHVNALKLQAAWLIEADDTDAAIAGLRIALDKASDDSEAMTLLAQAYSRAGQPELARDFLALAVDASRNAPAETVRYARLLMREENYRSAEDVLLPAIRLNPRNFELLTSIGQLYLEMNEPGRTEQVVASLRDLDDPRGKTAADGLEAELINRQSGPTEAIKYLESVANAVDAALSTKVALIRAKLGTGDPSGALQLARDLRAENPDNDAVQSVFAAVASANGLLDEAEDVYRTILERNAQLPQIWLELSRIKVRQGDGEGSKEIIETALEKLPESPNLLWAQASILERNGDIEGAIAIYESLYERNSNSAIVVNNLASLLSTYRGDEESLSRAWVIARRLKDADVPAFQDTYGWLAHQRGDSESALPYLKAASQGLPRDPLVQYHLATVYKALGNNADALRQFSLAVELAGPADQRDQINDAREQIIALQNAVQQEN